MDNTIAFKILYVRQYKGKKTVYDVELSTVIESRAIRDAFGMYWRRGSGRKRLPEELKGITISIATTFPTRVRVRLLKELCRKHLAANPELNCFVTNYSPRPELKIKDRKGPMVSLSYSQAVVQLSHHLTHEFLADLYHYARTNLPEDEILDRFIVLTPDLISSNPELADQSIMSVDLVQADEPASQPPPPTSTPSASSGSRPTPSNDSFKVVTKKQQSRFSRKDQNHPYSKKN
jgi:hypothetical protein